MNYLAHLYLSPADAESMLGNLMGDFRKHLDRTVMLPEKVRAGINNHVEVDKFTDKNAVVADLKCYFSAERRRFAGIIIDVVFDYFLSRHWQQFSNEDINDFIETAYSNISSQRVLMPSRMQYAMDYMVNENWLQSYASLDGINEALERIAIRIRFENTMPGAISEVEANYDSLEQGFLQFFPQLKQHIENTA